MVTPSPVVPATVCRERKKKQKEGEGRRKDDTGGDEIGD
jgi:hypothetical protein